MRPKTKQTDYDRKLMTEMQADFAKAKIDIDLEMCHSETRQPIYVYQRALMCYYFKKKGVCITQIGKLIGRDHSTVIFLLKWDERSQQRSTFDWKADTWKISKLFPVLSEKSIDKLKLEIEETQFRLSQLQAQLRSVEHLISEE